MKKLILIFLAILSLGMYGCDSSKKTIVTPKVEKGFIDLSNWDFKERGKVELEGEWEFYWMQFLTHTHFENDTFQHKDYIQTGKMWSDANHQKKAFPPKGYSTYRVRIKANLDQHISLKINRLTSAGRYYIDDQLISKMGTVATSKEAEELGFYPHIVNIKPKQETFSLIIHVSNHIYFQGGLHQVVEIGGTDNLNRTRQSRMAIIFFLTGSILIMALYHLGLFALRRTDYSSLFFGLFALFLALRTPANGQYFIATFIDIPWQIIKKIDFGGYYGAVGLLALFLNQLFPKEFSKWFTVVVSITSAIFTSIVITSQYSTFGRTLASYQYFTLIVGAWTTIGLTIATIKKRESSIPFLLGFIIMFATAVNDILHARNIIFTAHIVPFGFFIFIFSQAFLLSARFSNSYKEQKRLTNELNTANRELESRVQRRTRSLQEANQELSKLSIVADKTDNGVLIMDATGNLEWINGGFTRLTGYSQQELTKSFGQNIVDISNFKHIKEWLETCIEEKRSVYYETYFEKKGSDTLWLQTTLTPVLDKNQVLTNIVAVATDITQQKISEAEIQQQKVEIEAQRDQVVAQRDFIASQNKRITDSLIYARNIQNAITPSESFIKTLFNDAFILNLPKDIVSGDFVWATKRKDEVIITVADCTGHGVPGAFMSSLGITFLNQIINVEKIKTAGETLTRLRQELKSVLDQENGGTQSRDGIDMALCIINTRTLKLQFAGAYNPLWIIRNNEIDIYRGDRMPVGAFPKEKEFFSTQTIQLSKNDSLYMFSDGYTDQFFDGQFVKFNSGRFKKLLLENHHKPFNQQQALLRETHEQWKGSGIQIDDIMVLGVKV